MCNPDDRKVNFGALRVGQSAERIVKLRNNSAAAITFSLVITPSLMVLQQSSALTVSPSSELTLEPNGGSCNVHVMFTPTTRIPQFTEEVFRTYLLFARDDQLLTHDGIYRWHMI